VHKESQEDDDGSPVIFQFREERPKVPNSTAPSCPEQESQRNGQREGRVGARRD
jgi:hypothetical protein